MTRDTWHVISDINAADATAVCQICGPDSPLVYLPGKSRWACRAHRLHNNRERKRRLREQGSASTQPPVTRDQYLRYRFGINEVEYDALLASQGGVCALCGGVNRGRNLAVDHDHSTGRVRGLLCTRCNAGLGCLGDTAEAVARALDYLRRSAQ